MYINRGFPHAPFRGDTNTFPALSPTTPNPPPSPTPPPLSWKFSKPFLWILVLVFFPYCPSLSTSNYIKCPYLSSFSISSTPLVFYFFIHTTFILQPPFHSSIRLLVTSSIFLLFFFLIIIILIFVFFTYHIMISIKYFNNFLLYSPINNTFYLFFILLI